MQGCVSGSRAPLGLLLVCLQLPGLFARSIGGTAEEKASPPLGASLPVLGQPPSSVGNDHSHVAPASNNNVAGVSSPFSVPVLGAFPAAGRAGGQRWPPPWRLPPTGSWLSEVPWQVVAGAAEDPLEQVLPEELAYLSAPDVLPQGGGSWPEAFSVKAAPPVSEASPVNLDSAANRLSLATPLGAPGYPLPQRPFWSLIYRLLPRLPWGALNPNVPWGGGVLGTRWGTKPMQYPSGAWGINSQFPGGGWGNINSYPGGGWVNINRYPRGRWGDTSRDPGSWGVGSWGNNSQYPGAKGGRTLPAVARPLSPSWYFPSGFPSPQNPDLQYG